MKVAVVFILLFATVLCRPARRMFDSSSESSEEVVRRPAARYMRKQAPVVPQTHAAVVQNVAAASDESKDSTDEVMEAAETPVLQFKSGSWDATLAPDSTTDGGQDSDDSDEDDDDTDENDTDEDEDDSNDTSESGESSTVAPTTVGPTVVTEVFVVETTEDYINPTIVTDDSARGDSLGHPSDYKSIYVEDKSYHKIPAPYKSYEYYDTGKKSSYDTIDGNEVEKSLKVYKALQVHAELLEEDTSTPEVESQGLDGQDQDVSPRQASLPVEAESTTTSENDSSSATQEEEEQEEDESTSAANDSASAESEDAESQSSEEATATAGAADSDSDESESEEEGAGPDSSTNMPVVITAK